MKKFMIFVIAGLFSLSVNAQAPDSVKTGADTSKATAPADTAKAAEEPKKDTRTLKDKIDFGFGGSFWINSRESYIELCPSIAYRFPKRLVTGVGYRYIYRHIKEYNNQDISNDLHTYGPTVFAKLDLFRRLYFWTEYEFLNTQYFVPSDNPFSNTLDRETQDIDSWFVGLGISKGVGKSGRGGISVQVLYNVLYDDDLAYNPYYSAWTYRIGFFF